MQITPVHPDRPDLFEQWYAALAGADRFGREETAVTPHLEEMRISLARAAQEQHHRGFAGLVDGRVVATGWLRLPLLDNRWSASLGVHVVPQARRLRHGSSMLAHLERLARAEGRTTLLAQAPWPYADGPDPRGPAIGFVQARGFDLALTDVQRQLALPVPSELLDRLAAEAPVRAAGYRLRSWIGPVPHDLVAEWAALDATTDAEAPTGDLDIEPQSADTVVVRDREDARTRQGRVSAHAVALAPDGRLAAYTEISVSTLPGGRTYQLGTLVRHDDRGRRLGLAVKVACLRRLQDERPEVGRVITYNAESNAHMVAINDALGFVPTERMGHFQKGLSA